MSWPELPSHGPGYATPLEAATKGPREKLMYVSLISCNATKPDCLATVDVDPESSNCGKVINTLEMPYLGDELHHFGWNTCSSCCSDVTKSRRFLVLPGNLSSRIYIVDTLNARAPVIHKILEPELIKQKFDLSAPHTLHCLPDGQVMISMLGNGKHEAPGGFLLLDSNFNIAGRWENGQSAKMPFNHDFWYQAAHNVMVSTEFAAPKHYYSGFKFSDLAEGNYGHGLCFWNWKEKTLIKRVDLGQDGKVTLGARFLHDPMSTHGFLVSALSGSVWHWFRDDTSNWQVEKVIQLEGVPTSGWPIPVPAFCSDLVVSLDDRFIFVSNWFNGDIRQYDISNPHKPLLVGHVWCGAGKTLAGQKVRTKRAEFHELPAGPHMMQLSLDGKRLYVTNSFLSSWDDQFYSKIKANGGSMLRIDVDTQKGGMEIDENFFVDFGNVKGHKYRAHEMRYPGGDCTSDIWIEKKS